jgi:hypothetical protein
MKIEILSPFNLIKNYYYSCLLTILLITIYYVAWTINNIDIRNIFQDHTLSCLLLFIAIISFSRLEKAKFYNHKEIAYINLLIFIILFVSLFFYFDQTYFYYNGKHYDSLMHITSYIHLPEITNHNKNFSIIFDNLSILKGEKI